MKRIAWFVLFFLLSAPAWAAPVTNGELVTVDQLPVLRLWGTAYEMGYAQGQLLGDQLIELFTVYLPEMFSLTAYQLMYGIFTDHYRLFPEFEEEAQGVIDGAVSVGCDPFILLLGREITALDVALAGASADIDSFLPACSSVLAWGDATAGDAELAGQPILGRNLDWLAFPGDETWLARQTLIVARTPSDGRRPTVSVAFPGFLGCLSCLNDAGVVAVQHQAYPNNAPAELDFSRKWVPINLAIRAGLEMDDADGDENATVDDVIETLLALPRSSAYNVIVVDGDPEGHAPRVVELRNRDTYERRAADEPLFPPQVMAATNDFRVLQPVEKCPRYRTILQNAVQWQGQYNIDRVWQTLYDVEMDNQGMWIDYLSAQSMIFLPAERRLALAYADETGFAPEKTPNWTDWNAIFGLEDGDDDDNDDDDHSPPAADDDASPAADSSDEDEENGCGC